MSRLVTTRRAPLALVIGMLGMGVCITFTIDALLGGTVREAPPREAPIGGSESTSSEGRSDFPAQAGNPSLWRTSGRRKSTESVRARRRPARRRPAATRPAAPPSSPDSSPASVDAGPPSASPSPRAVPRPVPAPKPKPAPRSNGGGGSDGNFYNTG